VYTRIEFLKTDELSFMLSSEGAGGGLNNMSILGRTIVADAVTSFAYSPSTPTDTRSELPLTTSVNESWRLTITKQSTSANAMPFLEIENKQIHYADLKPEGQDVRETFIFIHGLGSSQNYYHAVVGSLLASGFRCIIFDNTGAGRSPHTPSEKSVQSLGDDVIGILDALGVAKAVVVGHSMGG
jgi:predicted alpha/beta-fold hydrolase